jgi:uncharacterized protein (DUF952 family)
MQPFFHLTTPDCWAGAQAAGEYRWSTRGKTLDEVGFIHGSFLEQVERVADFVYAGVPTVLLLAIDPAKLTAEVRVENLDGGDERFPHIYGPLPVVAVIDVQESHANAAGRFHLPA